MLLHICFLYTTKWLFVTGLPLCMCVQPLTVTTASLTMAENLADLIDGYCRLVSMEAHSFIVGVQKGMKP